MKLDVARETALRILYKIEEENGYSNLVLDEYLKKQRGKLSIKDINLISEIVYGTISWKLTIDAILQKYSKVKLNKIAKWVKIILRIGIYQIVFLDKIPKSAAVNESVNLCKKYGHPSTGFVNAILRKIDKNDYYEMEQIQDDTKRLCMMYSMPSWIIETLLAKYSLQQTQQICENSNIKPRITIRTNTLKGTTQELKQKLQTKGIIYEESQISEFLHLKQVKDVSKVDLFEDGFFTVQDEGAGQIAKILNPLPGQNVLDACSAPGGKTTHLAELMKNTGNILAWDIHASRIQLVEENAKRLGISIIKTDIKDASQYEKKYEKIFDKILLDVPCMGIGVLKRKPDIKWQKTQKDITSIQKIQETILLTCTKYLKIGGELVYSTCSLLKEENEDIINKLMANAPFEKIEEKTILPDENTDGFFICKLKRK